MLHSFGSNGRGQLSLSHTTDISTPTPCTCPPNFPTIPPTRIVGGGNHTLVLFPNGELYATGDNTHSQCIPTTTDSISTFHRVPDPPDTGGWRLVSAGWNFTVRVAGDRVYSVGHGPKGELGLGLEEYSTGGIIPDFPPEGTSIERVDSGMAHTVAVLSNGHVYGWGAGRKGQLGAAAVVVNRPRRIMVGWSVEYAVCGREFTFLVERAEGLRRVAVLGGDRFGIGDVVGAELDGVVGVEASWNGVYVLFGDGRLVGYGRDDRGQIPKGLGRVERFAVGSEHGVAVVGGKLVAWGWGEHGNCGKGRDEPGGGDVIGVAEEVRVAAANGRIEAVGAGCATSWVWVEA